MKAVIVGGGIIGLSSAFYLQQSGWQVTVIEKNDFPDSCCPGSAGYICPSHFIPMATPGIVKKGFKWMWNAKSPFYVQPRLNRDLINWGLKFIKSATKEKVDAAAIPLRDISMLSKQEYENWITIPGFDFAYQQKGLLEIFQTDEYADHARHAVEKAHKIGLTNTLLIDKDELQSMEPQTTVNAAGAIYYKCDAHCDPGKLIQSLLSYLAQKGVQLIPKREVKRFEIKNGSIQNIYAGDTAFEADEVIIATGSWGMETAKLINLNIPLVPGRGYSITMENSPYILNYPAILMEGRTAVTPMGINKIRFGGTMEITSHQTPMRMNRVQGIINAVQRFYPEFDIPLPAPEKVWYGYRPCSPDGLPYIGRVKKYKNLTIATGHAMLGLSLGAGTGKIVNEIVNNQPLSMDMELFNVERFS